MFGLKVKRRIVVIESDDWGSQRMPSKKVYDSLLAKGIDVDRCPYSKYDSLENEEDLQALFTVLNKLESKINKVPIITTNFLSANPNFEKIKSNKFSSYEFENIDDTYKKNSKSNNIKNVLKEGISNKYISPQFHGREHINVQMWMNLLNENKAIQDAFDYEVFALSFNNSNSIKMPFLASFMKLESTNNFEKIISSGIEEFERFFGFTPKSFIAPVYIWDQEIEELISHYKINSVQGLYFRNNYVDYEDPKPKKIKRSYNKYSNSGQLQLVRNCFFEPSTSENLDWVGECLQDVETAFFWNRPAIICSHRINFVGGMLEKNRNKNLTEFEKLVKEIVKKWPDVIFVSSDEVIKYV